MPGPPVDVVVNNHDYARYLPDAIDSALAQTHPATRVIVVDDGSTDGSREIIGSYGRRIEAVLKDNGGQASAMNAGMTRCRDGVVMFLDADDALEPHAAERVAERFAREPGLARVHFRLGVMDAEGRPTGELKPPPRLSLARGDLRREILRHPFDGPWLPTTGNAFSAAALRRIMPIPEPQYRICADWYLVHVSALEGDVGAIDEPLGRYRVHSANGFTRSDGRLDLPHLAQTVEFAELTRREIGRHARQLGIPFDPGRVASMCDVANRTVLLRLGASRAPGDSAGSLLRAGLRACSARRDVAPLMKLMFMAWLAATLAAPRSGARRLGELFLLPERRKALDPLLEALHRT
jgi:hypothetical protein